MIDLTSAQTSALLESHPAGALGSHSTLTEGVPKATEPATEGVPSVSTESKVFVGFVALILCSHIHRIMLEKNLYKTMTMKDLIKTMEKLRTQVIDGRRILFPLTKRQKEIYKAFAVPMPV